MSKATKSEKSVKFDEDECHIQEENRKPIAYATTIGNLYYLNCSRAHQANATSESPSQESKEVICHKRYGQLGVQILLKLENDNQLVEGYDYDKSKDIDFCESYTEGKHHRSKFPVNENERAKRPLGFLHSDVSGEMKALSLSRAEYTPSLRMVLCLKTQR